MGCAPCRLTGVLTGFLGIGGGFVIVPALVILLGLPMTPAVGTSLAVIAARLFLSPKTVEFHLTQIYRKLEIHSRSELVRRIADVQGGAAG